jgi:hypothetical protein
MHNFIVCRGGWVVSWGTSASVVPPAIAVPRLPEGSGPFRYEGGQFVLSPRPSPWHKQGAMGWEFDGAAAEQGHRTERDARLQNSDWVVLRAADRGEPVPPEWLAYRQALRDITEQPGFPQDVVWPEPPDA